MERTRLFTISGSAGPFSVTAGPLPVIPVRGLGSRVRYGTAWVVALVFAVLIPAVTVTSPGRCAEPARGQVTVMHYFADELGHAGLKTIFSDFEAARSIRVTDTPIGHEDFKNSVLELAAKGYLQDVISYWAGSRAQFLVDNGAVEPLDDLWKKQGFDRIIPVPLHSASRYNARHYLVPFGYHCVGFFYNPGVFSKAGITALPATWDELKAVCEILLSRGIKPFALGARHRWPAQFWFDYILLRTAGPVFRERLMNGHESYCDPRVNTAMAIWKELLDKGFFLDGMTTEDWTDAADRVAGAGAAMTLMGTWITGYWNSRGRTPGADYDFFEFPVIDPGVPVVVVGPVDGLMISATARNADSARELITHMVADLSAQSVWARTQGALSPNTGIDPGIYDPVMKKALKAVSTAAGFAFNYDLATHPTVAEKGLTMFNRFLLDPSSHEVFLRETQDVAQEVFTR